MRTMMWLLSVVNRLRALFLGRRIEHALDAEIAFHLESRTRELVAEGMPEAEARTAARRAFGNVARASEDSRAAWRYAFFDSVLQDVRYGARALRRAPVFTVAVTLTLAMGIGANTAIFTIFDRVLLRSLVVTDPDELVTLGSRSDAGMIRSDGPPERDASLFSYPLYRDFLRHADVYSGLAAACSFPVAAYLGSGAAVPGQQLERAYALLVSGNLFRVLGAPMRMGRPLTPEDDAPNPGNPVVVLSHGLWARRYGQDPGILGRSIRANGTEYTVVGVAGPGFRGLSLGIDVDLWMPMAQQPRLMREASFLDDRNTMWLRLIGRLRSQVTRAQALTRTNDLFHRLVAEEAGEQATPETKTAIARLTTELVPFARGFSGLRRRWERPLLLLMAVVGLVLLIACANVGNLLLARASSRRREFSMRLALGAGSRRLVRQLLTESLMLSLVGGALGLLVARWTSRFLLGLLSSDAAEAIDAGFDGRVLLFAVGVTGLTTLLFGPVPAVRASRVAIQSELRSSSATGGRDGHGWRLRRALVVFQVAVSLCLLVGAGLLLRSLSNLRSQDLGFRADSVLTAEIDPQGGGIDAGQLPQLRVALLERIGALPGVRAASLSLYGLLSGSQRIEVASVDGYAAWPDEDTRVHVLLVTPRYFEAIGTPVTSGRPFDDRDRTGAPRVGIVSESFARHYLGGQQAVGRRFGLDGPASSREIEIVGTVRDIKPTDLRDEPPRIVYRPAAQATNYLTSIEVRTSGDPAVLAPQLRRAISEVAPGLPVLSVTPLATQIDTSLREERMLSKVTGLFGLVALALAAIGLHGVLAYGVAQRTSEIGIRLALGAHPRLVFWMVLKEALAWVGVGAAIGLAATLALGRLVSALLFGLDPIDPATIAAACTTLAMVAVAAASWPARRAARLNQLAALRCE
jgi:predicted permease